MKKIKSGSVKLTPSEKRKVEEYEQRAKLAKPPFQQYYSGDNSQDFWKRVNALPDDERWQLYTAGVLLQNMEGTIVRWLNQAESAALHNQVRLSTTLNRK
jgi:hypothetical protein